MQIVETIAKRQPQIANALQDNLWKPFFEAFTLSRSTAFANTRCLTNIRFSEVESNSTSHLCANVYGNHPKPYSVFIELRYQQGLIIESDCSCLIGADCVHAAALLEYISKAIKKFTLGKNLLVSNAQTTLNNETLRWLKLLEQATTEKSPPKKSSVPYHKFLAYCIEKSTFDTSALPHMVLRVGNQGKSSQTIENNIATADLTKPPKYMTDEDIRLVGLYRRIARKQGGFNTKLMGPGWDELLEGILAQGRLYHTQPGSSYRELLVKPFSAGPPEAVNATWTTLTGGTTLPILEFTRKHLEFLPTNPARYIDFSSQLIGKIESEYPAEFLIAWNDGPPIEKEKIQLLVKMMGDVTTKPLPVPVKLDFVTRENQQLTATLRIEQCKMNSILYHEETFVAVPEFQYGDSPKLPPLEPNQTPTFAKIIGNTHITWTRDLKRESQLLSQLKAIDFVPLANLISKHTIDSQYRSAVTFIDDIYDDKIAWIDFLSSAKAAKLREAGWQIVVDPKSGLSIQDATEFFSEIEQESDHGIDWFRFDMQFTAGEKKMSLIPFIAEIIRQGFPPSDSPDLNEYIDVPCENPEDGFIRFPARRLLEIVEQVCHLFHGNNTADGQLRLDRLSAAGIADTLAIDSSETTRTLAKLGRSLKNITTLPLVEVPETVQANLRPYQLDGYRWLQFLTDHGLNGILADDMGLGKTIQTLTHLAAECAKNPGKPSLVIAPTSVVPNWTAEAIKFTPNLRIVTLQGKDRAENFIGIPDADIVLTSYPLITRDFEIFAKQEWHLLVLDEAQYIKNPKAIVAQNACKLKSAHRVCLSGTPMENHLGELWSLMRFLMPGFLGDEKSFNTQLRKPIERDRSPDAQIALNRRVSPLILRRTKDQVATDLPAKTELIHHIDLTKKQTDLYESVRASMDKRVRDAIAAKGLAKSHIIVLDALLKLRQICCHPQLLKSSTTSKIRESAKLEYLTDELLPTLFDEGRRILLFSQFTSMLALIEEHLKTQNIPFLKLTGQTTDRASLVTRFQTGEIPIFLISLKAGGTGLNLTAADTVIHYDPWWNPAAENQATDRVHRIGQTQPVFVHKLVCRGTIEDRILDLQKHKAALVEALLSEETSKLKIDAETLSHLLSPLD